MSSSFGLIGSLWLGIERTNFGARLRASVDNRRMAEAIGIDTGLLFTVTFALGSGLAALGGGLGADILAIYPGYAVEYLVYFLMVVAVGGLGRSEAPSSPPCCWGSAIPRANTWCRSSARSLSTSP